MNDKLSLQDLADILSQQTQINKKEAESFFKEFFQLILDRIYENDLVKVKDFGTFKLTAINSRESVDVNTGEKIEIPAHYRFTFLPDKALKELVNEPFSKYQTVLLEEGMDPSTVNFELQTNTEEDTPIDAIDDNEVSKIIQEQAKLVNELKAQPSQTKTELVKKTTRGSKIELIEKIPETRPKKDEESHRFTQKPFVYTYSDSKIDENKKDEDVILMTVPRRSRIPKIGEDSIISSKKIEDKKETSEKVRNVKVKPSNEFEDSDIDDFSVDIDTTIYSISDIISKEHKTSVGKKQEHTETKEDKKTLLVETSSTSKGLESDSPLHLQEDVPILNRNTLSLSKEKRTVNNIKSYRSDNNPDRPLIPEEADDVNQEQSFISKKMTSYFDDQAEEIDIDTTFINVNAKDLGVTNKNNRDSLIDKSKEILSDKTEIRDVENDPFFNFEAQSAKRTKLKKMIPIVVSVLIVLSLVAYGLFKLLDVKYDYERYQGLGTSNLTMADTLPYLYETDESLSLTTKNGSIVQDYADSLSETNTVVVDTEMPTDISKTASVKNINGSLLIDGSGKNEEGTIVKDSARTRKRNVSNNLSISIVDKAQYFLHKKNEIKDRESGIQNRNRDQSRNVEPGRPIKPRDEKSDSLLRMEQGMTLRSISSRYYGNANYWIYIYMANKEKLPNPDAIRTGLELSIPALNQYGVIDPKDPKEIEKAQRLETDILG